MKPICKPAPTPENAPTSGRMNKQRSIPTHAFTLIELLVVMTVIALLLSIAAPRYFAHIERAKESSLRQSLAVMRDAIDKYQADRNQYPSNLDDLVKYRYLRAVPKDPYTDTQESWKIVDPPSDTNDTGVYDVHSGADGQAQDGTPLGDL
jgi:general secretion pathway protein G